MNAGERTPFNPEVPTPGLRPHLRYEGWSGGMALVFLSLWVVTLVYFVFIRPVSTNEYVNHNSALDARHEREL
jgi:hypothetical protein